jgi:hypothetical protein
MKFVPMKGMIAAFWILAVGVLGVVGNVTSLPAWGLLLAVAFAPPLTMLWFWRDPPATLSESINSARR